jgi:PAS domain S-box-containing protein
MSEQIEDVLRETARRLNEAQAMAHVGSWEWDVRRNVITWSDEMYRIAGLEPGSVDITYESYMALVPESARRATSTMVERAFREGRPFSWEDTVRIDRGRWIRNIGHVEIGPDGAPWRMYGTSQDVTEQMLRDEALRDSEQLLREAEQVANIGSWSWDLRTNAVRWSEGLYRIFGIDADAQPMTYASVRERLLPEHRTVMDDAFRQSLQTAEPFMFEGRFVRADGTIRWAQGRGHPVQGRKGIERMFGTVQDVTERKNIEDELRETARRLNEAQAMARLGSWEWDVPNNEIIWSEEMYRVTGIDPETKITADTYMSMISRERRHRMRELLNRSLSSPEPFSWDETVAFRDRWLRVVGHTEMGPDGKPTRMFGTTQDVTAQTLKDQALRDSEHQLQEAEAVAHVGSWSMDPQSRAVRWSSELYRIFGFEPFDGAIDYEMIRERFHPDDRGLMDDGFRRLLRDGVAAAIEGRILRTDGSLRWIHARGQPVDGRDGTGSIIGTVQDITDRKEAEQEVRASRARIVQAADAERRRVERDLHDGAQQRLVSLAVALQFAQKQVNDNQPLQDTLAQIAGELHGALAELREFARGIHPAILTEEGLAAAIESLTERCPVATAVVQLPEGRFAEHVEAAAYFVVSEALTNIVKYAGASKVTVSAGRRGRDLVVEVADDGAGGADPAGGSGLRGLQDRLAAIDGRLDIVSPAGGGTRVRAVIPCA